MTKTFIIIPVALLDTGNALAVDELANGGPAFVPTLSADGNDPATHAACNTVVSDENRPRMAELKAAYEPQGCIFETYDDDEDPTYPTRRLQELGLQQIVKGYYKT